MEALKRLTLGFAVAALGVVGCGDDDDTPSTVLDASLDSAIHDASSDASGDAGDAASFACSSGTLPTATMCGGSHCLQTPAQLQASVMSGAACSKPEEISQFCQLTSVSKVQQCILANYTQADVATATKTCATPMLPDYTSACLDCFVQSAVCAAQKCLAACVADPGAPACDQCRVEQGCIPNFYACSGITSPF